MSPPCGPFETERQAAETPAMRAVFDAFAAAPGVGRMTQLNHRMLDEACAAAGVELGAYDHRILVWLAGLGAHHLRRGRRADHPGLADRRPARSRGGGIMKIRLHGTEEDCRQAAELLGEVLTMLSVSDPYPDRGRSSLVRVYIEATLGPHPWRDGS